MLSIPRRMLDQDAYSLWLGIEIVSFENEVLTLCMKVREEMTNGFGVAHGGISYSLADTALAFIANMEGFHALSIDTTISHIKKVNAGDDLRAFAQKDSRSRRLGVYTVKVKNQMEDLVAIFKGTVYISEKKWLN